MAVLSSLLALLSWVGVETLFVRISFSTLSSWKSNVSASMPRNVRILRGDKTDFSRFFLASDGLGELKVEGFLNQSFKDPICFIGYHKDPLKVKDSYRTINTYIFTKALMVWLLTDYAEVLADVSWSILSWGTFCGLVVEDMKHPLEFIMYSLWKKFIKQWCLEVFWKVKNQKMLASFKIS